MSRSSSGPLSDNDYTKMNKTLAQQEMLRMEIEKAMEAGVPCAEMDEACKGIRQKLTDLKKVYFPDRP